VEEAWELAAVSEGFDSNEVFNEDGLKFVVMNEFLIRFHLVRLSNFINDYRLSYKDLQSIGLGEESDLPPSEKIWDLVIDCAENLTGIANILRPNRRGKKGDLRPELTKKRSEAIQGLLLMKVTDRTDLVDFRNRIHHEDEDVDDWYFRKMTKAPQGSAKVIRRYVSWGTSPVTSDVTAYASAYDAKTGFVHFYDKHYNLHEAMKSVEAIDENVTKAHERLTELTGNITEVTLS